MQMEDTKEIPKRARFYQSMRDSEALCRGEKYREVVEKAIREYMEYFATNKASSPETEDIDRLVKWYQTDSNTRIRYMTWQEERARADKFQKQADAEKARADKYEKMLKEHGLL